VDLRGQAEVDLGQSLGTFLGYYVIRCRAEKDVSLGALTAQIAAQTRPIKEQRRYFDSLVGTKLLGTMFARVLPARRREFLDGALPLTAGVTNVVLRDAWIARDAPGRILGYLRAAPTGPVVPLALAPSTCGEQLNIGATYRTAILSADTVGHVMSALLGQLERPE
jgi:hypothetical protein